MAEHADQTGGADPEPGHADWTWTVLDDGKQSRIPMDIPVPDVLARLLITRPFADLSFNLLWHRYVPMAKGAQKQLLISSLARAAGQYYKAQPNKALLQSVREQAVAGARAWCAPLGGSDLLTIVLTSRLAIGVGLPSSFETGISLHHLTGAPHIPAAALKGLTRAAALESLAGSYGLPFTQLGTFATLLDADPFKMPERLQELLDTLNANRNDERERDLPESPDNWQLLATGWDDDHRAVACYRLAFGTTDARGRVLFTDAHALGPSAFEPDLVNPHGIHEYEDPVPAFFLTVPAGARFQFVLGSLGTDSRSQLTVDDVRRQVRDWLATGLRHHGIGAKTAVGYGTASIEETPAE